MAQMFPLSEVAQPKRRPAPAAVPAPKETPAQEAESVSGAHQAAAESTK